MRALHAHSMVSAAQVIILRRDMQLDRSSRSSKVPDKQDKQERQITENRL